MPDLQGTSGAPDHGQFWWKNGRRRRLRALSSKPHLVPSARQHPHCVPFPPGYTVQCAASVGPPPFPTNKPPSPHATLTIAVRLAFSRPPALAQPLRASAALARPPTTSPDSPGRSFWPSVAIPADPEGVGTSICREVDHVQRGENVLARLHAAPPACVWPLLVPLQYVLWCSLLLVAWSICLCCCC